MHADLPTKHRKKKVAVNIDRDESAVEHQERNDTNWEELLCEECKEVPEKANLLTKVIADLILAGPVPYAILEVWLKKL